ncbi:MAG: hypothetical protein ACRDSF_00680 [Pseudonocardiaceae bacterium]
MMMTWYRVSDRAHHGLLARSRLHTACGLSFDAGQAERLDLDPGQLPGPEQICVFCAGEAPDER